MSWREDDARRWAHGMARGHVQPIDRDGAPYLARFYLAGWRPGERARIPALYLHHFVASDADDKTHSHPWGWSASLILAGGYVEQRCGPNGIVEREFRPGDVNVIGPDDRHRIDLLGGDCWTLFLAGAYDRPWHFHDGC